MKKPSKPSSNSGLKQNCFPWKPVAVPPCSSEENERLRALDEAWMQADSLADPLQRERIQQEVTKRMLVVLREKKKRLASETSTVIEHGTPPSNREATVSARPVNSIIMELLEADSSNLPESQLTPTEQMCFNFQRYIMAIKKCEESGSSTPLKAEIDKDSRNSRAF